MSVLTCREDKLAGFTIVSLSNGRVRADILPELGGRIWNLFDVAHDTQWIWHDASVPLARHAAGTSYDDHWAGGWEELFPNDAQGEFEGRFLPDHGEWWTLAWRWSVNESADRIEVRMQSEAPLVNTALTKIVSVDTGSADVKIRYALTNREGRPLKFLFKQHLPVALSPAHQIELPGGEVIPVDLAFSNRIGAGGPFPWPFAKDAHGETIDLREVPPYKQQRREFVYVRNLPEGWCGVVDSRTGRRLRLHYRREIFPFVWFFMAYGGWRDIYTVVLEPCTNMPKDLATADRLGQCAVLGPGATLDCEVRATLS
jgi:hypothetical protein